MLVGTSVRGNAAAAKSRCSSQIIKRYVTGAGNQTKKTVSNGRHRNRYTLPITSDASES